MARTRHPLEVGDRSAHPAVGYSAIIFVALISLFLLQEGLPAFGEVPLASLFGTRWYPIEELLRRCCR